MRPILPAALLTALASPLLAEGPVVVTDIAPVQSLVARIMQGSGGTARALLPAGASPHDFSFRPSDARALTDADLLVWIGEGLTPWLARPVAQLSGGGAVLELLEAGDWDRRAYRQDADFDEDHGDGDDDHDEDDHDDHADEAEHDHGDTDPHAWLDPLVAAAWAAPLAEALAEADPANADLYRANAVQMAAELTELTDEIAARLDPLEGRYIVAHDAYGYFDDRFDLTPVAAITLSDAAEPGPRHIAELRAAARAGEIACILTDPQTGGQWTDLVGEGTALKVVIGDPMGGGLEPGPGLYPAILDGLADAMVDCLSEG